MKELIEPQDNKQIMKTKNGYFILILEDDKMVTSIDLTINKNGSAVARYKIYKGDRKPRQKIIRYNRSGDIIS